jgi:hypothetical protein
MKNTFTVRIDFRSEYECYSQFHSFPRPDSDYICGWSRKRVGSSQMILLELTTRDDFKKFVQECLLNPSVECVEKISEAEFWEAPSNSV